MNAISFNRKYPLNIEQFNMSEVFYTNSIIFHRLKVDEKLMTISERMLAFIMLILFFPIMTIVALAIKTTMGGSIFYHQTRVGKNGSYFSIIKFRTMIENAEEESGPILSCVDDFRVTKLGKFLRASHLDELPQLINVILGQMSFVGPRPERPIFVDRFEKEIADYNRRKEVKPGITGLAQICLPYNASAQEKLEYDIFYIDHKGSLLFNCIISYYTALKMLTFFKN